MKILYIGNYKDGTGWGDAAIHNIMALSTVPDITVVPRSITFNNNAGEQDVPPLIFQLENNDVKNVDVCVQHVLPHLYSYQAGFKNVGMYYSETNNIDSMMWHKYINQLDSVIVCNNQMVEAAKLSGVTIPIEKVPIPINYKAYQNIQCEAKIDKLNNSFNFCFVGELNKRKNITTLLKAFHSEFHPSENVNLFLKISHPGLNPQQTLEEFRNVDRGVTNGLKIRKKYKEIIAITGRIPKQELLCMMKQCHVFVCTSFGEAYCLPALEAMAMGLPVIYPADTGLEEFAHGWKIKTTEAPCFGAIDTLPELYSSYDTWQELDLTNLMFLMRSTFEAWHSLSDLFEIRSNKAKYQASLYDYENIGKKLKDAICRQ